MTRKGDLKPANKVIPGDIIQHRNGGVYEVTTLCNVQTKYPGKYPVTAVYQNIVNDTQWARPINDLPRSFKVIMLAKDRMASDKKV